MRDDDKKNLATAGAVLDWCEKSGEIEAFLNQDGRPYATFRANQRTVPIEGSGAFDKELMKAYRKAVNVVLNRETRASAAACLAAETEDSSRRIPVFVRRGHHEGRLYIDIGDDTRDVIVLSDRWGVAPPKDCPVRFFRPAGMKALPRPQTTSERLDALLEPLLRNSTRSDNQRRLIASFLVFAIHGSPPYPLLSISGPQGSSKSGLSKLLRYLIDPIEAPIRSLPSRIPDLWAQAAQAALLVFDNVSALSRDFSDALCQITSEGSSATRKLYTDGDVHVIKASCPVILNGIPQVADRSDLISRTLFIALKPITATARMTDSGYRHLIEKSAPQILGAALDAVANGMRRFPSMRVDVEGRSSEFTTFMVACEEALGWSLGSFKAAFEESACDGHLEALDACPITKPILDVLDRNGGLWDAPSLACLRELNDRISNQPRPDGWPRDTKQLGEMLARLEPDLAAVGVRHESYRKGKKRDRMHRFERLPGKV